MKLQYHDATPRDFEQLVLAICEVALGPSAQSYSSGPDGGRDVRFSGIAAELMDENGPLQGAFIAQAKHTEDPSARFGDSEFSGTALSSVLTKEIPRIRGLVEAGELDHYLLFSNRRLAGNADSVIRARLIAETGVKSVELFGLERLDQYYSRVPRIANAAAWRELALPLTVTSEELATVIGGFSDGRDVFAVAGQDIDTLERTRFDRKNQTNGLTDIFAEEIIGPFIKHFAQVKDFLAAPGNEELLLRYDSAASELKAQLIAHRHEAASYDGLLVSILQHLYRRDPILHGLKRQTALLLYYMYFNCDIGQS